MDDHPSLQLVRLWLDGCCCKRLQQLPNPQTCAVDQNPAARTQLDPAARSVAPTVHELPGCRRPHGLRARARTLPHRNARTVHHRPRPLLAGGRQLQRQPLRAPPLDRVQKRWSLLLQLRELTQSDEATVRLRVPRHLPPILSLDRLVRLAHRLEPRLLVGRQRWRGGKLPYHLLKLRLGLCVRLDQLPHLSLHRPHRAWLAALALGRCGRFWLGRLWLCIARAGDLWRPLHLRLDT
mmetsp:Transcript_11122/g.32706  ORF Transcript_11122/g.32706 Transcript_11122/m.32706 type:complete len:237 (-) Transcript_11122:850-1560(-)